MQLILMIIGVILGILIARGLIKIGDIDDD